MTSAHGGVKVDDWADSSESMRCAVAALKRLVNKADERNPGRIVVISSFSSERHTSRPSCTHAKPVKSLTDCLQQISAAAKSAVFATSWGWRWLPEAAWRHYMETEYTDLRNNNAEASHEALAQLEVWYRSKSTLKPNYDDSWFTLITANTDCLHQIAGSSQVLELYGSRRKHRCIQNGHIIKSVSTDKKCSRCGGNPRPNKVLFAETVAPEVWVKAQSACLSLQANDVCVVVGNTDNIYPLGYLPEIAHARKATIIQVSSTKTRYTTELDHIISLQGPLEELLPKLVNLLGKRH
eukprot:CAMPEP_0184559652 /NCGR_PEP_ID=MMETSP0199_2-20130426/46539_1 /TAXON_ID=1112570 /ORGANISM="Thraustochytrium sp., Strain LLF1b" /LENGTH=294 /DNA_ID=CAMNT_0026956947 /DNA_START=57 /DNA_END=944 /DNA_ORIENTATION=+